jgi:hypothetical protein
VTDDQVKETVRKLEELIREHKGPDAERVRTKITVQYKFDQGAIPTKLTGTYDAWLKLWGEMVPKEEDGNEPSNYRCLLSFARIEKFLSRPQKGIRKALQAYAKKNPCSFEQEVYECVLAALGNIPSHGPPRARGKEYKDRTEKEMHEIKLTAACLYEYLGPVYKNAAQDRPAFMNKLMETYDVENDDTLADAVCKIIGKFFGIPWDSDEGIGRRFYKTFIQEPGILKRLRKSGRVVSENHPILVELFREFLK